MTGCNGQLGRAIRELAEEKGIASYFDFCDIDTFDMSDLSAYGRYDWSLYGTVINCGAYTAVDRSESSDGRIACWAANAAGPALLSKTCAEHGITLVHVSSDYVFDGTLEIHDECEPLSPLSVYGQSKAAGDIAVSCCPRHYIIRSSWVIGDGNNFVKTMKALSDRCADPDDSLDNVAVVDDQFGRLTFTRDMAKGIFWLLGYRGEDGFPSSPVKYGTYNLTGSGPVESWAQIAIRVFDLANDNGDHIIPTSTEQYYSAAVDPVAPRPVYSVLDLSKLETCGFKPCDWTVQLNRYLSTLDDTLE